MNGTLSERLIGSDDERAVSPVIGVILMVAITVILAAVIAAFVMGIGPGSDAVTANVDIAGDGTSEVTVTVQDGGSADNLVIVNPDNGQVLSDTNSEAANTGVEYTISNTGSNSDFTGSDSTFGTGTEYTIYAIQGDLSAGDPLDGAEGSTQVGTFELG
ncbi:type IV pilin [Halovivax limisalsi]|uniref:type IV pilin n=1 Tax=Halovivax limisalsi TaxID=1453760 RepID=UPI001FFDA60F|nr:type IV pilin N-terminal domain-containing protein [Halovivax limisalsi]